MGLGKSPEERTIWVVLGGDPLGKETPSKAKREAYRHLYGAVHRQLKGVCVLVEADPKEDAEPGMCYIEIGQNKVKSP